MEAIDDRGEAESEMSQALGQGSVLHFFSKLRRHASLEGAGPYFRRWKFDTTHRAASLDAKGLYACHKLISRTVNSARPQFQVMTIDDTLLYTLSYVNLT